MGSASAAEDARIDAAIAAVRAYERGTSRTKPTAEQTRLYNAYEGNTTLAWEDQQAARRGR